MRHHTGRAFVATIFLLTSTAVLGATRTWTGASIGITGVPHDNLWTNAFNWSPVAVPVAGDDLVFNGGAQTTSNNTFGAGTTFNTLTLNGHTALGNTVALNAGLSATNNAQIVLGSIKLNNAQTFTAPTAGASAVIISSIDNNGKLLSFDGPGQLVLLGVIGGTGGLTKSGSGTVQLLGPNSYTGDTRVGEGLLLVFGSQPGSHVSMGVDSTKTTATLGGSGTVGSVGYLFGGTIAPGGLNNGTGILSINGNLGFSINNASSLVVDLKGTDPGTGYDQVKTSGNVTLGSQTLRPSLTVVLDPAFTPAGGSTFTIIKNDSANPVQFTFVGKPEGSSFTVGTTTFFITYRGGDGNDVVLHVPTTRTWNGAGADNNWATAANWVDGIAPAVGDELVFPDNAAQKSNFNNFPDGTAFTRLEFNGGSFYQISGNAIALGAGGLVSFLGPSAGTVAEVANNITLTAPSVFQGDAAGRLTTTGAINIGSHTLTVNALDNGSVGISGNLLGPGEVREFGGFSGRLFLGGTTTSSLTGAIKVFSGGLNLAGSLPNAPIVLDAGGSAPANTINLTGTGTVGPLTIGGATVNARRINGSGPLTTNGNLTFAGNANIPATLKVELVGTAPGTQYGQVKVMGAVNLSKAALSVSVFTTFFVPAPGATFVIIDNDGTDPIQGTFVSLPEDTLLTVDGTTFAISYKGGDGNDVVLRVPTTRTWNGGGADNNWMTPANWVDNTAPSVGDTLIFPETASQKSNNNNFPAQTIFTEIRLTGGSYFLTGNEVSLVTELAGVMTANATGCSVNFVVSGPARVRHESDNGTGMVLNNANTYTGGTVIRKGNLHISGSQPAIPVTIENGTLNGVGSTGPVTITAPGVSDRGNVSPGSFVPGIGILTTKDVTFGAKGTLVIQFGSTSTPGSGCDQLNVNGAVALNDARLTLFRGSTSLPPVGSTLLIIRNDGTDPVNGTFLNLPEGATINNPGELPGRTGGQAVISYQGGDGNDVTLLITSTATPTPTPTPTPDPSATPTPTPDPSATPTPTPDPSATPTPTPDPSATPTPTPDPSATPTPTPDPSVTPTPSPTASPGATPTVLGNIATRLRVETGDNVLIGGFIITGTQDKKILLRGIGPSLAQFFAGALANPTLELYHGNTLLANNDDWKDSQRLEIEATTIPPTHDLESAIVATLPANNAGYTAVVRGAGGGTGIGVVEVYDLDRSVDSKLANISTRGFVQTGDDVLIAGTIVLGELPQKVLIRAIAPSLPFPGVLADPTLELRDANGALIQANDNWVDSPNKQAIIDSTIPPSHDLESAIVAILPAGGASYTAIVRGAADTTGIAVVEVYALQ